MQVFDINVGAGVTRLLDVQASYVYFLNGSAGGADTTIIVRPESGGETVYLKPGQAYEFNASESANRWSISNLKGEAAIVGQLLFAAGRFTDNRVTGSVEVIDGGKARTQGDRACFGYAGSAAVAGQYSHVQLLNPAGSGINLIVNQILLSQATASIAMGRRDAPLGLLVRQGQRKRLGSVGQSVAEVRMEQNVAQLQQATTLGAVDPAVKQMKLSEPIMVAPGTGLIVFGTIVNDAVGATFEFFEEAI